MSSGGREFLTEKMDEEEDGFVSVTAAMAVNGFSVDNFRGVLEWRKTVSY